MLPERLQHKRNAVFAMPWLLARQMPLVSVHLWVTQHLPSLLKQVLVKVLDVVSSLVRLLPLLKVLPV